MCTKNFDTKLLPDLVPVLVRTYRHQGRNQIIHLLTLLPAKNRVETKHPSPGQSSCCWGKWRKPYSTCTYEKPRGNGTIIHTPPPTTHQVPYRETTSQKSNTFHHKFILKQKSQTIQQEAAGRKKQSTCLSAFSSSIQTRKQ